MTPDRERLRSERDGLRAACEGLAALLDSFTDDDPCSFDHHGYCQTHGWFDDESECHMPRARRALAALTPDPPAGT